MPSYRNAGDNQGNANGNPGDGAGGGGDASKGGARAQGSGFRNGAPAGSSVGSQGGFSLNRLTAPKPAAAVVKAFTGDDLKSLIGNTGRPNGAGVGPVDPNAPTIARPTGVPEAPGIPGVNKPTMGTGGYIDASGNVTPGNQYPSYKGPGGTTNPDTSLSPGQFGLSADETQKYTDAKSAYANDRSFLDRAIDTISPFGFHNVNPQINQPAGYADSTYHTGVNPAGFLGNVASIASGVPGLGTLFGSAYSATGAEDLVLGGSGSGFSTSYPGGGPGYNSSQIGGGFGGGTPGAAGSGQPGSGGSGASGLVSATPSATASTASTPLQAQPANPSSGSSVNATGQQSQGGGTIISGSNSVAWPWQS